MEGKGTRGPGKDLVPTVTVSRLYYPIHNSFPLCLLTSLWLACSPVNFGGAETVKVKFQGRVESSLTRAVQYPTLLPSAFFWKGIPGDRTCLSLKQALTLMYTPISAVGDTAPNRKASPSLPWSLMENA